MTDPATPQRPAVSVLLPVRNGRAHLHEAMRSILDQTLVDLELIVIDDGSTDGSELIADQLRQQDPRVRLLRIEPSGIPAALNVGIERARGRWLARMDADDVSLPHRLQRLLDAASQQPDVVGWASWARAMSSDGRVANLMPRGPLTVDEFRRQHQAGHVDVTAATVLLDHDTVARVGGYDERFVVGEDIELYDRIGDHGPMLTVPEVLYLVRIHAHSTWANELAFGSTVQRFLVTRRAATRHGATCTFEEHLQAESQAPLARRALWRIGERVRGLRQRAVVDLLEQRRARAAVRFALLAVLSPGQLLRSLRRRLLARRLE